VTGVATSFVGRKEGLAARLTSHAVADNSHCAVAGLGFFEQGFYNQFGFGTSPYDIWIQFDPANLKSSVTARRPERITADDYKAVHESRLRTPRRHGGQTIGPEGFTRIRMKRGKKAFGLGYRADDGRITHMAWFGKRPGEDGPLHVHWLTYETPEQLVELMGMMKRMGDQVRTISMHEPPGFQIQDLVKHPIRDNIARDGSKHHEVKSSALAHRQLRMNDPVTCLAATSLPSEPVRFNLELADPIERFLDEGKWRGCSGKYVVALGGKSSCTKGTDPTLPTAAASVNAFTRLWMGALPATTLAVTDDLSAPAELLAALDDALVLPTPRNAWGY
jgi:hypothetical protein